MSSRGSRADKDKGKAIADSSESPRRRQYVNPYGGADSGFYNDPSGGGFYHDPSGGGFYNNPTTQMEVDEEVVRWIQFQELQRSQESHTFSRNPSIDLDTEEAEEEQYKFRTGGGYGTYWSHINNNHQVELGRAQAQSQLNFQPHFNLPIA
ncbi:hypothetical protein C2S52_003028 [Perilla frutescens var. hirtella]|nr:hypothetical protein C2S51_012438 [Perilla frutescens var. frutescens]KAH6792551.1 hypothetical protein C2S52_003028 [Perilla frutescens var. hirtella]